MSNRLYLPNLNIGPVEPDEGNWAGCADAFASFGIATDAHTRSWTYLTRDETLRLRDYLSELLLNDLGGII